MTATAIEKAANNGIAEAVRIDYQAVLKTLNLNPTDPKVQALVLTCQQYDLDPVLKHMVLIQGTPYVTHKGLWHIAHRSGELDGHEVVAEGETPQEWFATVSIYRKGWSRPVTMKGRYPKSGTNKHYGPEMAVTRAECLVLRRLFDVSLPVAEERDWEHESTPAPAKLQAPPPNVDTTTGEIAREVTPPAASVRRAAPARKSADKGASTNQEKGEPVEPVATSSGSSGTSGDGEGEGVTAPSPSPSQSPAQRAIVTMAMGLGLTDHQRHQVYLYATDGRIDSLAALTVTKDTNAVQRTLRDLKTGALNFDADGDLVVKP